MAYNVPRIEAEKFSRVWNKGGISIILTPEAIDFATDFANVAINSFIQMCQDQVQQAVKAAELEPKPKIILEGVR